MGFSRINAVGVLALALTACSGAGSSAPPTLVTPDAPAGAQLVQQGMPLPFNPATDSLASLGHVTLASVSSSTAGLWNFETPRWDVTNTSRGNVGGPNIPGDVLAYSVP